jgi:hypothetical protein
MADHTIRSRELVAADIRRLLKAPSKGGNHTTPLRVGEVRPREVVLEALL